MAVPQSGILLQNIFKFNSKPQRIASFSAGFYEQDSKKRKSNEGITEKGFCDQVLTLTSGSLISNESLSGACGKRGFHFSLLVKT